jgi:hypothetical protein
MSTQIRQLEIRQEARFVLWALRCGMARQSGDPVIEAEIHRGFELADVLETRDEFWRFAEALAAVPWSHCAWHDPRCCCASSEELLVLQALAEVAERCRNGHEQVAGWWRMILPANSVERVDGCAREWISALSRAGVEFPAMHELIESLGPLSNLAQPAGSARLN